MTLTPTQAETVYLAMCVLNNIGGRLNCSINEEVGVHQAFMGTIFVSKDLNRTEHYRDQAAFAAAYGLK